MPHPVKEITLRNKDLYQLYANCGHYNVIFHARFDTDRHGYNRPER